MKHNLLLSLFSLLLIGFISSCKDKDVTPVSPIVGQWDLVREITTGVPSSYSANGTATTNLNADTYDFKSDGTFSNPYSYPTGTGTKATRTESGTWELTGTTVTLTITKQSPSTTTTLPTTYDLTYSASANELTTGPLTIAYNGPNPVTGATDRFNYTTELVYKKK